MKGFASGVGGVCICMLAIMGTILCGFALGGEEVVKTTTRYDMVADTTGLFDTTQARQFIDYNPAANWTGYRTYDNSGALTSDVLSGVTYSTAAKPNTYPIPATETQVGAATYNLMVKVANRSDKGYTDPPGNSKTSGVDVIAITDSAVQASEQTAYIYWPRVSTAKQVVEGWAESYDGATKVVLDLVTESVLGGPPNRIYAAPASSWTLHSIKTTSTWATSYQNWMILPYTETAKTVKLSVDLTTDIAIGLDSDGNELWRSTTGNTTLAFLQAEAALNDGYPKTTWDGDIGQPTSLSSTTWYKIGQTSYMDVSQGVVPNHDDYSYVEWSNGYTNGKIDVLIRWNESAARTWFGMRLNSELIKTGGEIQQAIYYVSFDYNPSATQPLTVESFDLKLSRPHVTNSYAGEFSKGILVSMDLTNDTMSAYGIETFRTFQDYTLLTDPIITTSSFFTSLSGYTGQAAPGGITCGSMRVGVMDPDTGRGAATIGVVDTSVYMGDSSLMMSNPTIRPHALWIDDNAWELRLYSFAIDGESIRISGDGGIIAEWQNEDGKIRVGGGSYAINDIRIRAVWDQSAATWKIHIAFAAENSGPIYVGETSDSKGPIITLPGYWYFTSAYYAGENQTEKTYQFDFQKFIFDSNAAILCFMGILILGAIVAKRMGGLGIYDMIVLIFAGVCGFVLMVG